MTSLCSRPARRRTRPLTSGRSQSSRATSEDRVVGRVPRAPERDGDGRHPLRHPLVEARHDVAGSVGRHAAVGGRARFSLRFRLLGRGTRRTCHSRTSPTGKPGSPSSTTTSRSSPSTAARAAARTAPLLLEEREVGPRASRFATRTSQDSGRRTATTRTVTRGSSSASRAIELADRHRGRSHRGDGSGEDDRARCIRLARPSGRAAPRCSADRGGRIPR